MENLAIIIGFVGGFRSFSSEFSEQLLFELSLELEASFLAFKSFLFFRSKFDLFKLLGNFSLFGFSELSLNKLLSNFLSLLKGFTFIMRSSAPSASFFRLRSSRLFFFFVALRSRFNLLGFNDLEIIRLVAGISLSGSDVKLDSNSLSLGFSSNEFFVIMLMGNSDFVAVLINVLDTPSFGKGILE